MQPRKNIVLYLASAFFQHEFVQRLSAVLVTVGASPVARMAAGLQLKNQLTSKDPEMKFQYQQRWLTIPAETRDYIKKNVRYVIPSCALVLIFQSIVFFYGANGISSLSKIRK